MKIHTLDWIVSILLLVILFIVEGDIFVRDYIKYLLGLFFILFIYFEYKIFARMNALEEKARDDEKKLDELIEELKVYKLKEKFKEIFGISEDEMHDMYKEKFNITEDELSQMYDEYNAYSTTLDRNLEIKRILDKAYETKIKNSEKELK